MWVIYDPGVSCCCTANDLFKKVENVEMKPDGHFVFDVYVIMKAVLDIM